MCPLCVTTGPFGKEPFPQCTAGLACVKFVPTSPFEGHVLRENFDRGCVEKLRWIRGRGCPVELVEDPLLTLLVGIDCEESCCTVVVLLGDLGR